MTAHDLWVTLSSVAELALGGALMVGWRLVRQARRDALGRGGAPATLLGLPLEGLRARARQVGGQLVGHGAWAPGMAPADVARAEAVLQAEAARPWTRPVRRTNPALPPGRLDDARLTDLLREGETVRWHADGWVVRTRPASWDAGALVGTSRGRLLFWPEQPEARSRVRARDDLAQLELTQGRATDGRAAWCLAPRLTVAGPPAPGTAGGARQGPEAAGPRVRPDPARTWWLHPRDTAGATARVAELQRDVALGIPAS